MDRIQEFNKIYDNDIMNYLKNAYQSDKAYLEKKPYYFPYYDIVKQTSGLYKDLKINDPYAIAIMFEYMLWQGYFSLDGKYKYDANNLARHMGLMGADIMTGKGVCINNAAMLRDILNASLYEAYLCGCSFPVEIDNDKPDIERKAKQLSSIEMFIKKIYSQKSSNKPKHAITLINNNGNWFLSDPTNLLFLEYHNFLEANFIGNDKKIILDPQYIIQTSSISNSHFKDVCLNSYQANNMHPSQKELLEYSKKIITLAQDNKDILDDFHDVNYDNIEMVARTLKK